MFTKKGYCHIDGKVCTINFCGGSERVCGTFADWFIGHAKTSAGPKRHLLGLESAKSGNLVPNFENFENMKKMLTEILCIMAHTLFQTSSRGSDLKQNRFGRKLENTVKTKSYFKCGSEFLFQKQLK